MKTPSTIEIKEARLKSGLTQQQASELLYVHPRTWQKWENGEREMHKAFFELFLIKTIN